MMSSTALLGGSSPSFTLHTSGHICTHLDICISNEKKKNNNIYNDIKIKVIIIKTTTIIIDDKN